jgi:hypothetical protein
MKVTNIWAGKDILVPQSLDRATNKMSRLTWSSMFSNEIHPMHIEHNIACNTASKPGATDKSMCELIERCGTNTEELTKNISLKILTDSHSRQNANECQLSSKTLKQETHTKKDFTSRVLQKS